MKFLLGFLFPAMAMSLADIEMESPVLASNKRFGVRMHDMGNNYLQVQSIDKKRIVKIDPDLQTVQEVASFDTSQFFSWTCGNVNINTVGGLARWDSRLWTESTETISEIVGTISGADITTATGVSLVTSDSYAGAFTSDCTKFYFTLQSNTDGVGIAWINVDTTTGALTFGGHYMCDPSVCSGTSGFTEPTYFRFGVSGDGNHAFIGRGLYSEIETSGGAVLHFKKTNEVWSSSFILPPTSVSGGRFGHVLTVAGSRLFVVGGSYVVNEAAATFIYKSTNGVYELEATIPYTSREGHNFIMTPMQNELRVCWASSVGTGTIRAYDYIDGVWTQAGTTGVEDPVSSYWGSESAACGTNYMATSDSYTNLGGFTSVGKMFIYTLPTAPAPPPQCTVSPDCTTGTYCRANTCHAAKTCTTHAECNGEFDSGRLSYCDKVKGKCSDIKSSTCATSSICNNEALKLENAGKSVGTLQQTISVANGSKRTAAAKSMITKLKNVTTVTSDVVVFVESTETMILDSTLFTNNDQQTILQSIANVRCGDSADQCTVSLFEGINSGRRLSDSRELVGSYTVTVTFDVTDEAFAVIDNSTSFDDPSFAAALAAAAGVNPSDVDIQSTSGDLVITFTLVDQTNSSDPTDPNVFNEITSIQSSLVDVTSEVVSELAIDSNDILSASVDLCNNRDCGGFGAELCNSITGICACPDGWWGVNCDVATNCENGGTPIGSYCQCVYPHYGTRCQFISTCTSC